MVDAESRNGAGRLKNGFNMIARDLDRAFALAMLGSYEVFMLQVVREESWAASLRGRVKGQPLPDPIPCKPNCSAVARVAGLNRCLVSRGLNDLVESRVLVRDRDGTVLINKEFDQWVYPATSKTPERPRFDAVQIEYIRGAEAIRKGQNCYPGVAVNGDETATPEYQSDNRKTATPEYQSDPETATPGYQFDDCKTATPGYQFVSDDCKTATPGYQFDDCKTATPGYQSPEDCYPGVAVTATPGYQSHIERAREERVESKEDDEEDARETTGRPDPTRNERETVPIKDRRPFDPSKAEVKRVAALAATLIPGEEIGQKIAEFSTSFPMEWIEDALICAASNAKAGHAWQYAVKCLLSWWAKGQPDHTLVEDSRTKAGHCGRQVQGVPPSKATPSPAYHRPAQLGNREKYLNPKKPTTIPAAKPGE